MYYIGYHIRVLYKVIRLIYSYIYDITYTAYMTSIILTSYLYHTYRVLIENTYRYLQFLYVIT